MKHTKRFSISPVSAAVALALGMAIPSAAFAAGMPGAGTVTLGGVTALAGGTLGANLNGLATITGLANGAKITTTKATVIQWGGATAPTDTTNSGGFNVLAGNTLNVANGAPILNVDASNNTSTIAGAVLATGNLFIANANGITVTPGATISAPVVGLIGANLATTATLGVNAGTGNLIAPITGPQIAFTGGKAVDVGFGAGGNMNIAGTINNGAGVAAQILIAGSGSVNVNATGFNYSGKPLDVMGGVGFTVINTGVVAAVFGNKTSGVPAANAYAATNVSLTNAAPTSAYANGNLTFSGFSTLPATKYGWSGVLENTAGSTLFTPSNVNGQGMTGGVNPWWLTKNALGTAYVQSPVGSINNAGLMQTVTTGLTTTSNGFTNTGTLRIGNGGILTVNSGAGDINLGGTVQGTTGSAAVAAVGLGIAGSGNINVSAPLTISGTSPTNAYFRATAAKGNVSITGAMTLTDAAATSTNVSDYLVIGNNITIGANQTVTNSNGTTSKQPRATLFLNGTSVPGTVTIGAGSTLTAGDVNIFGAVQRLTNLVADGNITATNTTDATLGSNGRFTFVGNNMSGAGAGTITAQAFDLTVSGNVRKSTPQLTNNYWSNGLVLTSAGATPTLNMFSNGTARQFLNFRVAGPITVNSATPFGATFTAPALSGVGGAGDINPNRMSQMMLMSTGNMTIGGGGGVSPVGILGAAGGYFFFPGLSYFGSIPSLDNPNAIGTGSITALGDVNNSVAVPVSGGQGLYFMTNNLTLGSSLYTNYNSYVNFANATQAAANRGIIYRVQPSGNIISNTLNMQAPTLADGVTPLNITNVYTIPTTF